MEDTEKLGILRHSRLFQGLARAELGEILSFCQVSEAEPGQLIYEQEERGEWLYVVGVGNIAILNKAYLQDGQAFEEPKRMLTLGGSFGWGAIIEPFIYKDTARSMSPTSVISINTVKLSPWLKENPQAGLAFYAALAYEMIERM